VTVRWVHRNQPELGAALVAAVAALTFPAGRCTRLARRGREWMKELRRLLKLERGINQSQLSDLRLLAHGADDEAGGRSKRAWNTEIEQAEAAVVQP